ncbi:14255_t:CDS:2 [Acaulospora morrowiae]|uniref:14255_t:CDS:1 n=1 Tax=Acaulospora morrowiae TaxID=94023 RepID=A0A9N9BNS6_9GLOM|nr:14255_t:CDS:2 [Acaulospora morrowiae]
MASAAILANIVVTDLVMEKGTRPGMEISSDKFVPRPEIVKRLKKFFNPMIIRIYYMVCGEHGIGKTMLTRIASSEVGHGVMCVDVLSDIKRFGEEFGSTLNFTFEKQISFTQKILGTTKTCWCSIQSKPPVIVYDNISLLVHKNPEIIDSLQDDAKDNADDRKYIAVFVSSEGSVPRIMECKNIIKDLLKPKELSYLAFVDYFNNIDKLNEVLGSNIFAYHPEKNTVSLQSQSVKYYILEKVDIFIKKWGL